MPLPHLGRRFLNRVEMRKSLRLRDWEKAQQKIREWEDPCRAASGRTRCGGPRKIRGRRGRPKPAGINPEKVPSAVQADGRIREPGGRTFHPAVGPGCTPQVPPHLEGPGILGDKEVGTAAS